MGIMSLNLKCDIYELYGCNMHLTMTKKGTKI